MKKLLLTLTVLLASAFAIGAQETLTVAEGTVSEATIPLNSSWWDTQGTTTQVIYPESMIDVMEGATITSIKFYTNSANGFVAVDGVKLRISLGTTDKSEFVTATPVEGLTVVKTDAPSPEAGVTEVEFVFDTPYTYEGGNLVFECYVSETAGNWKSNAFKGANQTGKVSMTRNSVSNFMPQTTFTYTPAVPQDYAATVNVNSLEFGKTIINTEKEMKVVLKNKGSNPITPVITGLEAPFSTTYEAAEIAYRENDTIPVKFAPTEYGEFTGTMTINCGEAGTFTVALSGNCPNEFEVTVCDGENQSQYAPIYGYYCDTKDTFVQMLYPADMLTAAVGAKIIGVRFYPTAAINVGTPTIELALKETDVTAFEAESSIAVPSNLVTDLTTVDNITLTANQAGFEFEFDQPFTYEGGNLAIQTLVAEKGTWQRVYFNGVNQETNTAYAQWGPGSGSNQMIQFLPKMTLICTNDVQPQPEKAYYLIGKFNEWNEQEMVPFVEQDGVFTLTKTFSGEFKIKDEQGKWWGGGATLTAENPSVELDDTDGSDNNLVLAEEAEYTLTIEDGVLTVTGFPEPVIPEYSEFYVVGDFNDWNQTEEGGRVELVANEEGTEYTGTVEMVAQDKFKVITPNPEATGEDDQWIWFGGIDENQVDYFLIDNAMLNAEISLVDGANFLVSAGGEYTITVKAASQAGGTRALQEPLVMVVTMKPTAISTISSDMRNDNAWYGIGGIRYESRPTAKGIYIHNGKKVVIK